MGGAGDSQRLVRVVPLVAVVGAKRLRQLAGDTCVVGGPLGLALQMAQTGGDLVHQELDALHVLVRRGELRARLVDAQAIALDIGRLIDELPAFLGTQVKNGLHQPLADDGVGGLGNAGLGQQLVEVAQSHSLTVDAVLALAVAVGAAAHGDLAEVERQPAVGVVQREGHLRLLGLLSPGGAREDGVLRLAGAQDTSGLLAQHPTEGVCNVGLARAVGPDDGGNALTELERGAGSEALEALDVQPLQVHLDVSPRRPRRLAPRWRPQAQPASCCAPHLGPALRCAPRPQP